MHAYHFDSSIRKWAQVVALLLAVLMSPRLAEAIQKNVIEMPYKAELPTSILGLYGLLAFLFNHLIWKLSIFGIPNLNGEWKISGKTSYGEGKSFSGKAHVKQTASKIQIDIKFSKSFSKTEAVWVNPVPSGFELIYTYVNDPAGDAVDTMGKHNGTTNLKINNLKNEMDGFYYTNSRDRETYGKIKFKKIDGV